MWKATQLGVEFRVASGFKSVKMTHLPVMGTLASKLKSLPLLRPLGRLNCPPLTPVFCRRVVLSSFKNYDWIWFSLEPTTTSTSYKPIV